MIRKISIQDVVSKRNEQVTNDPNRHERDFLIERLTRKHTTAPIADSQTRIKRPHPARRKKQNFNFFKFNKKWLWLGLPLIFVLLVIIVLQFMVSATITIKPKQSTVPINTKLVASINATTSPNALTYQIITLNSADQEEVSATSTVKTKAQKASGQITIFNNYSSASQTLISNTRFETSDGLIYRIQNAVRVPGFTISSGKTVPGSVTVSVIADQTGSKYDINMTDFSIPGFKTDAGRYLKIFARSKTAMTGGKDENSFGVSDNTRQNIQATIESRLRDSLLRQVQSQKTANSIIFDAASKISFQHLADTAGADAQHAIIHEQGTISSVVFDKTALSKILFTDAITAVGGAAETQGLESLRFIAAVSSSSPVWQVKPFTFTLTGSVNVVGIVDTNKLLQDVLGIPRADLNKVLSNYPTIDKATATVKPFWRSSFPKDASKIKVEIVK
jgi:hypothetical protein